MSAPSLHIPGCVRSITLYPEARWPVALRNVCHLHGTLTHLFDTPHAAGTPNFMLLPWQGGCGWAVQWVVPGGEAYPNLNKVNIFKADRILELGPPLYLPRPPVPAEGVHHLLVETVTPVFVRLASRRQDLSLAVEPGAIRTSLSISSSLARVLGREVEGERILLSVERRDVRPVSVHTGGKWGDGKDLVGWEGTVLLRCNAYTRHLLELAALVGMGGRTGVGFGRVRVQEVRQ